MHSSIRFVSHTAHEAKENMIILLRKAEAAGLAEVLTPEEYEVLQEAVLQDAAYLAFPRPKQLIIVEILPEKGDAHILREAVRKAAAARLPILRRFKIESICLHQQGAREFVAAYAEGLGLANYQFLKYRSEADKLRSSFKELRIAADLIAAEDLAVLQNEVDAACWMRDMVNEPLSYLTAERLAEEFKNLANEAGFTINVLNKAEIEALGMGGLLGVNKGSVQPPTFSVMGWKPASAKNAQPIVLVGKGLVYDTGGLSLKPTPNSMDFMKCDMAGGAVVGAMMYLAAKNNLPLHLIGLVPATDNRPGGDAYVPGDILHTLSGLTVEVLNTDAEGRLILADALHFAKQYNPELVCDFATLTGAASVAVGTQGCVYLGTASKAIKTKVEESGFRVYERALEFPLWEEYDEMIKSEIADVKNIGGSAAGAITAGKFLQRFTDYPWLHFDIAGVAFLHSAEGYRVKGGTCFGLRLINDFLKNY